MRSEAPQSQIQINASPSGPRPSAESAAPSGSAVSSRSKSPSKITAASAKAVVPNQGRPSSIRPERFARTVGARRAETLEKLGETIDLTIEFAVGEVAVHPAHGVGTVQGIEEKNLGGTTSQVYVLQILGSGLKVMVPKDAAGRVGLRRVMSADEADTILEVLRTQEVAVTMQPWNRRFRAYTEMIASGSATEIAKVLRDMHRLKFDKELSFGERRLLDQAKGLLVQELALAKASGAAEMESAIEQIFAA